VKWAKLLDKLTIAGLSHQSAAELYAEITDHIPLLQEVCCHFVYYAPPYRSGSLSNAEVTSSVCLFLLP